MTASPYRPGQFVWHDRRIPVTGLGTLAVIQDNVGAVIGLFEA